MQGQVGLTHTWRRSGSLARGLQGEGRDLDTHPGMIMRQRVHICRASSDPVQESWGSILLQKRLPGEESLYSWETRLEGTINIAGQWHQPGPSTTLVAKWRSGGAWDLPTPCLPLGLR